MTLLPALGCVAMMFGAGAMMRSARRTPLGRLAWFARRAQRDRAEPHGRDAMRP
jgi:hypothetical protein